MVMLKAFVLCFVFCGSLYAKKTALFFTGGAHADLAREVVRELGLSLSEAHVKSFQDKEVFVDLLTRVRGRVVVLIKPMSPPVNQSLVETLVFIDALKRAAAEKIILCCPYLGYSRQDRRTTKRSPISSKLVAGLLEKSGMHQIITVDLHADQIQGFFDAVCDSLLTTELYASDIQKRFVSPFVIVAPDVGALRRNRLLAKKLGCELVVIDKRRNADGESEVMNVIGNVHGKVCLLVDDLVDTGGTLCKAADALMKKGAIEVHAYCTHAVLSGCARARITQSPIASFTISNSIPQKSLPPKFRVLSLANMLATAIRNVTSVKEN